MKLLLTFFLVLTAIATCKADDINAPVINNDTFWKTSTGSYIYSQGGGIFRFPDAKGVEHYYWYGVKYQEAVDYCPDALAGSKSNITNFLSVTCYQSDDLVNWTFVNDVLTPASTGWAYWVGRLGVAYIEEAKKYEGDVYVIGGESIYRQFLPYCTKAHITWIDYSYQADTHMVNLEKEGWTVTAVSEEQTYFDLCYEFRRYEK